MRQVRLKDIDGTIVAIDADRVTIVRPMFDDRCDVRLTSGDHVTVWGDLDDVTKVIWPVEVPI